MGGLRGRPGTFGFSGTIGGRVALGFQNHMEQYDLTRFDTTDMMRCRSALRNLKEEPGGKHGGDLPANCRLPVREPARGRRSARLGPGPDVQDSSFRHAGPRTSGLRPHHDAQRRDAQGHALPDSSCKQGSGIGLEFKGGIQGSQVYSAPERGHDPEGSHDRRAHRPDGGAHSRGAPARQEFHPERSGKDLQCFHVEEAAGSSYVPAQEAFVLPFGVRSVLGFGGMLPSGDLFATIVFATVHIPPAVAKLFAPLSLNVKLCLLPFDGGGVFE